MRRLTLVLLLALTTCTSETNAPPVQERLPLDARLGAGEARAGVVMSESELIGGRAAQGQIGDFKLYNEHIAVLIGQPGLARGYNPYGGSIIDADIVRPEGEPGRSAFGEVIVGADLFILNGETVEFDDGRDSGYASVHVTGKVAEMPLFSALFSGLFGTEPYDLEWEVEYVLEPGAHVVRCNYTFYNPGRKPVEIGLPAAGFIFDSARPFVQHYGFNPPDSEGTGPYYGAFTEDVGYLYGAQDADLSVVINDSGVVFSQMGDPITVRARERISYTHYLVVEGGDLAKAQSHWRKTVLEEAELQISGKVVDTEGQPAPHARVHVLDDKIETERDYVTRTRADAQGRYSASVPSSGRYRLSAVTSGLTRSPEVTVTTGPEDTVVPDLVVPVAGLLNYEIKDDEGTLLPAKLSIRPLGDLPDIPSRFGEDGLHYGLTRTVFAHTGSGQVELPAGEYNVFVTRGIEYELETVRLNITATAATQLQSVLEHSVETPGWVSTDTHIHSQLSPDSPDSFEFKVRAMVAEGLEVPVSSEHEAIGDFNPAIEALGLAPWIHGMVGTEITTYLYGHFNAYPVVADPTKPGNGRIDWYDKSPGEMFEAAHANSGKPFVQVNHPRASSIGGYLNAMGYDRETGESSRSDWSPDFDGLEVMNGCSSQGIESEDVQDWFSFLNRGHRVAGVGATDNHRAASGHMGLPRTYLQVPSDEPSEVTEDDFRAAFNGGRLVVSCGPFLSVQMGESQIGDTATLQGDLVTLQVKVQAPTWMDVDRVQVVVNGETVKTQQLAPVAGVLRFEGTLTASVAPGVDAWVLVATSGDDRHGVGMRNRPSFAFTNPIFLDGDGDGVWRSP